MGGSGKTLDIDASGALTIDSATSITIGGTADKPIGIDASTLAIDTSDNTHITMGGSGKTLDIDASGALTIDSATSITIDGAAGGVTVESVVFNNGKITTSDVVSTTVIEDDAFTNAKMNNMAVNTIKGRKSTGSGDPEDLTAANVRSIINVADGASVSSVATGTGLTGTITSSGTISLSHLGIEDLGDPDGDRIMFWDDGAGAMKWLNPSEGIYISGTTIGVDDDLRDGLDYIGHDNGDYIYFDNDSSINFYVGTTLQGYFHSNGHVYSRSGSTTFSDERLKDNISVVENALKKVCKLNGVTFNWKEDGRKSAGVIAQEVEKVLPSGINCRKVRYSFCR